LNPQNEYFESHITKQMRKSNLLNSIQIRESKAWF